MSPHDPCVASCHQTLAGPCVCVPQCSLGDESLCLGTFHHVLGHPDQPHAFVGRRPSRVLFFGVPRRLSHYVGPVSKITPTPCALESPHLIPLLGPGSLGQYVHHLSGIHGFLQTLGRFFTRVHPCRLASTVRIARDDVGDWERCAFGGSTARGISAIPTRQTSSSDASTRGRHASPRS